MHAFELTTSGIHLFKLKNRNAQIIAFSPISSLYTAENLMSKRTISAMIS